MNFLLENAAPYWVAGGVLLTMAAIVYSSLRTNAALLAMLLMVVLTAGGLVAEHLILTPRERAQQALESLLDDIQANDLTAVLARLSPTATEIRADAQQLMPEFLVEKIGLLSVSEITLDSEQSPASATVDCEVVVKAKHRRSGMQGGDFSRVQFTLEKAGEQWLIDGYSVSKEWNRGAGQLRKGS